MKLKLLIMLVFSFITISTVSVIADTNTPSQMVATYESVELETVGDVANLTLSSVLLDLMIALYAIFFINLPYILCQTALGILMFYTLKTYDDILSKKDNELYIYDFI